MTTARDPARSGGAPVEDKELAALFAAWERYGHIALAVSGGADSMALMRLAQSWAAGLANPPRLTVLTVDHGLRDASASEAEWVKAETAALGLPHHTLIWESDKPKTGIQAKARAARYTLMAGFARTNGIDAIATAHTADDQAETFLMRLGRGSGVDGLAAMSTVSLFEGIDILRPLLVLTHARLAASLRMCGQEWIEDPSNQNERYERVRVRHALARGQMPGLSGGMLALAARRLRRARDAIEVMATEFLSGALAVHETGFGEIALEALLAVPEEIALKCLHRLAHAFSGRCETLRMSKLEACHAALWEGAHAMTLGGCRFVERNGMLLIAREYGRMDRSAVTVHPGQTLLWDGRFSLTLPPDCLPALSLRPLGGDGIASLRGLGGGFSRSVPCMAIQTLPSFWLAERLCHVPFVAWQHTEPPDWLSGCHVEFVNCGSLFRPPCDDAR